VRARGHFAQELEQAVASGGLDTLTADKVVGTCSRPSMPFGIALNVRINGVDRLVPMVVEEPSVIAAASNAARMVRASGGFVAEMLESLMTAQVQLFDVSEPVRAIERLEAAADELVALGASAIPNLIERGGGRARSRSAIRQGDRRARARRLHGRNGRKPRQLRGRGGGPACSGAGARQARAADLDESLRPPPRPRQRTIQGVNPPAPRLQSRRMQRPTIMHGGSH
jgi:hypothetical protein